MQLFWIMALAYIAIFAFFLALGAFNPGQVLPWTLATIGLAIIWIAHAVWVGKRKEKAARDPAEVHARERRGF